MMKKILSFLLAIICMASIAGCAKKNVDDPAPATDAPIASEAPTDDAQQPANEDPMATLAPSSNKTVVTEKNAPDIYWNYDIAYHVKGCEKLTKDAQKIPWSMVEEIALRQCPVCNPPQYENYIENEQ
ncbi:MAG: hypothetical protein E7418_03250 [Ruminococcaceae bacterium]|nr:hypothetical protein [Oscillospiraceae bacterium]